MDTAVVLAAILLAVVVSFWGPLRRVRMALGLGHLVSTGHAFLILGGALGLLLRERTAAWTEDLSPLVPFVAGWVGFAAGMRFELRLYRTLPVRTYAVALAPALVAALLAGALGFAVLTAVGDLPLVLRVAVAAVMAAAASSSGPSLAAIVRSRRAGRASRVRAVLRMVELSTGVDDLLVVLLAIIAFPLLHASGDPGDLALIVSMLCAGVFGGAVLGAVVWLFLGGAASEDERLLLGLAMLAVIAGFAEWLSLSPAAVAATAAITLVNLPGQRIARLVSAIRRVERPAVVIVMTMIGVQITTQLGWMFFAILAALTLLRIAAKLATGSFAPRTVPGAPGLHTSPLWGLGLAPMGTLGLVVVFELAHVRPGEPAQSLLAAAAIASLVSEGAAPWLMLRLLRSMNAGAAEGGSSA